MAAAEVNRTQTSDAHEEVDEAPLSPSADQAQFNATIVFWPAHSSLEENE